MNNPFNYIKSSLSATAEWAAGKAGRPGWKQLATSAGVGAGAVGIVGVSSGTSAAANNFISGGNRDKAGSFRRGGTVGMAGGLGVLGAGVYAARKGLFNGLL